VVVVAMVLAAERKVPLRQLAILLSGTPIAKKISIAESITGLACAYGVIEPS
jgi:hypothetical protein